MQTINHHLSGRIEALLKIKKTKNKVDNEHAVLLFLIEEAVWSTLKTKADKTVRKIKSNSLGDLKLTYSKVNEICGKNNKNDQVKKIFDNLAGYGYVMNAGKRTYFNLNIHKLLIDLDYNELLEKDDYIHVYNGKKGIINIRCRDIIKTELLKNWHRKQKNK